jgi:hypothetical protein
MYVHRNGALAALAAASLAVLWLAPGASANTLTAGTVTQAPDQPWAGTTVNQPACNNEIAASTAAGSTNSPGSEVEPYVVTDPASPQHLVAAFQQDRWNDGGNNGDVAEFSNDGGANWTLSSNQAAFTICAGGTFDRGSDPSLAYSVGGSTVYQASLAFNANGPAFGGSSSVQVSRSTDGGASWQTPVVVQQDNSTTVLNDKEWVTADPTNDSVAYLVWDRLVSPSTKANPDAFTHSPAFRGPALFSKTTDGGATWSPTKIIFDPGQENQTIDNEIVAPKTGPGAGDLIDGFTLLLNKGGLGNHPRGAAAVAMIRSNDGGATWSKPTIISPLNIAEATSLTGQPYRTGDTLPQFTSDPSNGNLYVTWQDGRFSSAGQPKVAFSQSTDGGATWSTPIEVDQAPAGAEAFTPQISVGSDGTIGVSYYDNQNATVSAPGNTDEYIVHCHAASVDCTDPANWAAGGETLLSTSGSFDMTTAPFSESGFFTGDYEGLSTSGTTFDPYFVMAQPIATLGKTDPFANTAG